MGGFLDHVCITNKWRRNKLKITSCASGLCLDAQEMGRLVYKVKFIYYMLILNTEQYIKKKQLLLLHAHHFRDELLPHKLTNHGSESQTKVKA